LLLPSAAQQWSADRKALRWAEIAVYAAAAGLGAESTMAIRSSLELIETLGRGQRMARARLFLALAMILLGRSESALEMFGLVDADVHALSPRLQALRRALEALCERYRGMRNQSALLSLFSALGQQHFGGVARMIMSFPLADNASLRVGELNRGERRILAKLSAGDAFVTQSQAQSLVAKLGCVDPRAAIRAVARYPMTAAFASPDSLLQEA
jgi:hypothetical protein